MSFLTPFLYALFVWWFATGVILYLNGRPQSSFPWSFSVATVVALAAGWKLLGSAADDTVSGAYTAFTCAIGLWGWLEMSFLMGFITGPRTHACSEHCSGWRHFFHATQAIIYNDIATALTVLAVYTVTLHEPNRIAFWTLLILWTMRISAKLNLFLGVANLGEAFLPPHLKYLRSFFRRRPMNFLFPASVTAGTLACGAMLESFMRGTDAARGTGLALMITLLALALLEHWFMVLPLPSDRLWSWAVQSGPRPKRGRQTPRTMLASDSASSNQRPPHSVRSTSAN